MHNRIFAANAKTVANALSTGHLLSAVVPLFCVDSPVRNRKALALTLTRNKSGPDRADQHERRDSLNAERAMHGIAAESNLRSLSLSYYLEKPTL